MSTYHTTKSPITIILAFRLIELSYKLVDHTGLQIGVLSVVADFCVEVLNIKLHKLLMNLSVFSF